MNTYSLAENLGLAPVAGKEYKLFLVEVDDEDRERVLAGHVGWCEIKIEPEYADVRTDYSDFVVSRFLTDEKVTMTLQLKKRENGTYFTIENFAETEEEDEDEGS